MGVKFDYENSLDEIRLGFEQMGKSPEKIESAVLKDACEAVADAARKEIKRSTKNDPGYVHMADDVKVSNLKRDRDGALVRTVGGGKKTGTKWHLLEHGTYGGKGATHFMEKTLDKTEKDVEKIFNNAIETLLDGINL